MEGASCDCIATGSPYERHMNDGAEASVMLSGQVDIRYKEDSGR